MEQKNILIVSGEASGDLQAANLAKAILAINPQIKISAVGGWLLHQAGAEIFYDIKGLSVMGLFDVLKKLPRFFALKKLILEKIKKDKPAAVILVECNWWSPTRHSKWRWNIWYRSGCLCPD